MSATGSSVAVVASVPQACAVCAGREAVTWQWVGARSLTHRAPCPHCWLGLPAIYLRRWRTDTPRGNAS